MRLKKFLLLIATLLLSVSLVACGGSSSSNAEATNTDTPVIDTSRFTSVSVEISGDAYYNFDYCYIITDTQTGKQFLYTYDYNGYNGGAAMVEIGTTTETSTETNE